MAKLEFYVFDLADDSHVATIFGDSNAACEAAFNEHYGSNDYWAAYDSAEEMAKMGLITPSSRARV